MQTKALVMLMLVSMAREDLGRFTLDVITNCDNITAHSSFVS